MRTLLAITVSIALAALASAAPLACSDTPRGDQGIDFEYDGSSYTVPPSPEAGPDAHGPCAEDFDAGLCAQAASSGTPDNHFIVCTGGETPFGIQCVAPPSPDGSAADGGLFCCATGLY